MMVICLKMDFFLLISKKPSCSRRKFFQGSSPTSKDSLAIIIMTWTGPYFLFFCRGFKLVGPMVIMVYRMLAQDIVRCANNLNCRILPAQTMNK